jgi:translocation and assembly module TamB
MIRKVWARFKQIRRWRKIFFSLFLCVSLIILTLSALVSTEAGSHWIVRKTASAVHVNLGQLKGNLLTGLDVTSVDYEQKGVSVHAEKISFRWQPLSLFYTAVSVQSLSAENIRVHLPPSEKAPEPEVYQWPSLAQPVRIELDSIKFRNLEVQQGDTKVVLNSLSGSFSIGTFHLRVKDLNAINDQVNVLLNGEMGLRYPYALKMHSEWTVKNLTEKPLVFSGKLTASGDIKALNLQNDLVQPIPVKATAKISPALHDKKSKPIAEIIADWPEQALLPVLAERFNPEGDLNWLKPVKTTQGHLELKGWLNAYDVKSTVQAKTLDARLAIDLIAKGTQSADFKEALLQLQKLQLTTLPLDAGVDAKSENFLTLDGSIHLLPHLYWDVKLQGEHFNVDNFVANWPSDLHMGLDSQGEYRAQQLKLWVNHIDAGGELRNLAVSAAGEFHFDGDYWNSSNFKLAVGANQLMLKGQAGKALAVEWKINAPLLGQIDPSVSGSIISNGTLSGDIAKPNVQVNAQINQFSWRDYGTENLTLKLSSQAATDKYNLVLDAAHVRIQNQHLSHLTLKGDGNISQHALIGQIESPAYGDINFGLSSSWKDNIWRGQWTAFTFNTKKIPRWNLLSRTPMQADKDRADLGKLCLTTNNELPFSVDPVPASAALQKAPLNEQPSICAGGDWSRTNGVNANINLNAAPLSSLRAWFKSEVNLSGVLEGDLTFRAPLNATPVMTANLQTRDAKLLYQFQGGNVEVYPLQKASATATLKNNQLNAALAMDWASYGSVNAETQYSIANEKIQGSATIALTNLAPLEGLLPFLNNVQGAAAGKFNLAGTSSKPEITGNFSITGGSANLPKLGLELKNISFQVNSPSVNSAHVEGAITSGDGTLVTQGDFINLGAPDWYWKANVFGAGIRIIEQRDLTATISPNLKLSANAQSIELTGSTEIPWARANIKNLPESAVRVSRDVVIVEKDSLSVEAFQQKSLPFHTNVILYFGDDVRFKGFGLDTRLSGKANVIKEENRQVFTTGYVAVDKGVYKAYGQELSVERGRLIFQGPYDNPGLDIRAVRITDDTVTAGLDIGGTLQHPKSTVFAIPAKTDSEAMAILLTGKSLSNSSKEDAYAIIGAIGKLGMSQGDSMTSDIVHKFGLDEVSIKADKGLEQNALWVGKYITPKLFLHYVVGLVDQAFSLGLTYKVNDKVQVEAESGKTQSVDVIYKIER